MKGLREKLWNKGFVTKYGFLYFHINYDTIRALK